MRVFQAVDLRSGEWHTSKGVPDAAAAGRQDQLAHWKVEAVVTVSAGQGTAAVKAKQ